MIALYHKVDAVSPTGWWVSAGAFYRQMCELRDREVVFLDDYDPRNPRQCAITFDGVYENVYRFAFPILRHFGYPFELFVIEDRIGGTNDFDAGEPSARFADWGQLGEMVRGGGRLQFHSKSHPSLDQDLDPTTLAHELEVGPRLRSLDPDGFGWFAYPHGAFTVKAVEEVRKRFRGALASDHGEPTDPYRLPRVTALQSTRFAARTIGVLVPSYNYGSFLVEAVESVLRQTLPPDRILIIDDASGDETPQLGRAYAGRYPGLVHFERNAENLGIVATFNKGVQRLATDYVCVLGADNRMPSDYLARCAAGLDADAQCGVAYTDLALFGDRAGFVYATFPEEWQAGTQDRAYWIVNVPEPAPADVGAALRRRNFIHGSAMYRRFAFEHVDGYQQRAERPEDHDLFLRMVAAGWHARKVNTFLEYRQHSAGQTNVRVGLEQQLAFFRSLATHQEEQIRVLEAELRKSVATRSPVLFLLARQLRTLARSLHRDGLGVTARRVRRKLAAPWVK